MFSGTWCKGEYKVASSPLGKEYYLDIILLVDYLSLLDLVFDSAEVCTFVVQALVINVHTSGFTLN